MRLPIQITAETSGSLFALCSDGTIWRYPGVGLDWIQVEFTPRDNLLDLKLQEPIGDKSWGNRYTHQGLDLTLLRKRINALKELNNTQPATPVTVNTMLDGLWKFVTDLDDALALNGH